MVTRRAKLLLLACVAGGGGGGGGACKLTEVVTAPPGDPVIVVQGVMSTAALRQTVLVQQSASGDTTTGIRGANVQLTDLDPRGCATPTVQLSETTPGVYRSPDYCPLGPGDRLTLSVQIPNGHLVTGVTRIPGVASIIVRAGSTTVNRPPAALTIDRTRDSLLFTVDLVDARALQIEAVRTTSGEDPTLSFATDTTFVSVAGNLVDLSGDGRSIFRAGAYYELTAAAMDTNYFDFVRSFTNPLTGRGFINHLSGGAVGVFGSVAPLTYELRVTAPQSDPREGIYHLTGHVSGVPVDVTWDVYGDPIATTFRAFVDGQWTEGLVHTSANGSYVGTTFQGTMFGSTDTDTPNPTFFLAGTRPAKGTPFQVLVTPASGPPIVDTLTALQVSGP